MWDQSLHWYWIAGGLLISAFEIFLPGVLFIWFGLAAVATGIVVALAPQLPYTWQILIFALLGLVAMLAGRKAIKARERPSDHPDLNRRGAQYVGRTFTLDAPTADGRGRMRVDDTMWAVGVPAGRPDIPAGTHVRVTAVDGATLIVEPAAG